MFVSIRRYSPKNGAITKASLELLRRQLHDEFLPVLQRISGFHAYYVVNLQDRELLTLTFYQTPDGLAECTRCAAEYTVRNPLVYEMGRPELSEGEVLTSGEKTLHPPGADDAAAAALALWYEESRGMLLTGSER